jgi:hypothetical protein
MTEPLTIDQTRFNDTDAIEFRAAGNDALRATLTYLYLDDGPFTLPEETRKAAELYLDPAERLLVGWLAIRSKGYLGNSDGQAEMTAARRAQYRCEECGYPDVLVLNLDEIEGGLALLCANCHVIVTRWKERPGEWGLINMADRNKTAFAAELFVAAELTKQGHLVTITFGKEKAIDLMVVKADDPGVVRSVDVKGLAKPADWGVSGYVKKTRHPDVYIFCLLNGPLQRPDYFIVPKPEVDKIIPACKDPNWIGFRMLDAYKEKWDLLWA